MARLVREPIDVVVLGGLPTAFTWRQHEFAVTEHLDDWRDTGEWWAGEQPKDFWRVKTTSGGVFDLYFEPQTGRWSLYKAND